MKTYIVDANVLFAALISGKEHYIDFFLLNKVFTTDFAFIEIEKYRKAILKKSKLKEEQFFGFNVRLFSQISVLPALSISADNFEKAYDLCEDIDIKDVLYLALTLQFEEAKLVTRDKVLHDKLYEKGFENVVLFHEVFEKKEG